VTSLTRYKLKMKQNTYLIHNSRDDNTPNIIPHIEFSGVGGAWVGAAAGLDLVVGDVREVEGWVERIIARRIVCGRRRIKRGK
jgi:hypothetical protein